MAVDYDAQNEALGKQYDEQQAQEKQQAEAAKTPPTFLQRFQTGVGRVTSSMIDSAVATAEDPELGAPLRAARDVAAGATTGAVNTVDAGVSAAKTLAPAVPGVQAIADAGPIWDHAKSAILDFRDAVAVKDPSLADSLMQGVAQLAIPFTGYSRALGTMHTVANTVMAGGITDITALAPHDGRMADLLAMGQHAEGKLGDALRAAGPYGLNAYVNYLADRSDETEAQGRFKNALDGLGVNAVAVPMLHAAGIVLKQGQRGIQYALENGVRNTVSDIAGSMAAPANTQKGMVAFHGSPEPDLSELKPSERLSARGHGIYLSEDKQVAGAFKPTAGGKLYNVNVPDDQIAQMLHWDEPLKKQPVAQHAFAQLGISGDMTAGDAYRALSARLGPGGHAPGFDGVGDKAASEALSAAGVPGIRYPASGKLSQGGSTAHNFVVFDSKHAKIVARPTDEELAAAKAGEK